MALHYKALPSGVDYCCICPQGLELCSRASFCGGSPWAMVPSGHIYHCTMGSSIDAHGDLLPVVPWTAGGRLLHYVPSPQEKLVRTWSDSCYLSSLTLEAAVLFFSTFSSLLSHNCCSVFHYSYICSHKDWTVITHWFRPGPWWGVLEPAGPGSYLTEGSPWSVLTEATLAVLMLSKLYYVSPIHH